MVSEGVDIARLMILAYLTNTATELFFRQAIGRIVRNQGTDSDTEAYCFLPDDPRLRAYAAKIEEFQKQVISEAEEDEQRKRRNNDEIERRRMEILNSSDAKLARLTLGGKGHETNAAHIRDLAAIHGTTENEMAAIIADVMGIKPEQPTTRKHDDVTKEERMVQLRKTCSRLTNRIANKEGVEPKDIHIAYLKIANVAQGAMTEAQLEAKRAWLLKRLSA
jgi:superfamily II DNA or RNA helicase